MHSNTFNNEPFYSKGASARLPATTNEAGEVVGLAVRFGEWLWRDGFRYAKCGVRAGLGSKVITVLWSAAK